MYKEDPTILAWDILNEPRETSGNYGNVQTWIDTNAAFIKSQDANHMVRSAVLRAPFLC
jgi:mannan endo-1,4-beta-mannosidase